MTRRLTAAAILVLLLSGPAQPRETEEEKARKMAWKEAQEAFKDGYGSEDPKVRREAVEAIAPFADLGAAALVVEDVLPTERNPGVMQAAISVIAGSTDPKIVSWLAGKAKVNTFPNVDPPSELWAAIT